eukprot:snap_masked-scaffold336_size202805-processed-gene-1.26 protein:Tk02917 transcript:snap_masked-scaffold336_size202805-processed-gene-1.26-mRNA-1 annotation:"GG10049"
MKLVHKSLEKDQSGTLTLIPEETEDMWHVYNLIAEGDRVRASTIRKVTTESSTGSTTSTRVRTTLTIQVENIDFDTQACMLRLKGRNVSENAHVKMGAYHTLDVETNRKLSLEKPEWDSIHLERIELATDPAKHAEVAAIIMQEGLAHICLVTASMTIVRSKVEIVIPRKRRGNTTHHDKSLQRFYDTLLQAALRHINFEVVKAVLVASPGFTRDQFLDYVWQYATQNETKILFENRSKFLSVHASTGFSHSLNEVLRDPAVLNRLSDTKAADEVKALETFSKTLQHDQSRAFYGERHVDLAAEAHAIETLLISDRLFRAQDVRRRKKFVNP